MLRGFPVDRYDPGDARLVFWGLGAHMGVARPQGRASPMIADVRDIGVDYRSATGRGYTSKAALDYHSDYCDVVGLSLNHTSPKKGIWRLLRGHAA